MTDTAHAYLHGLPVLVLGLGDSGLAMARWCALHGAVVRVWDSREAPPQLAALQAEIPDADFTCAPLTDLDLVGVKLVLKSPGLAPGDARIAPLLAQARATGVLVQGELDLFARALADLKAEKGYAPRVLAITGTNGKTTTTALTALLVERAGKRVGLAGNIGPTLLDTLREALARETWPQPEAEEAAAAAEVPPATTDAEPTDEPTDEPTEEAVAPVAESGDDEAPLQLAPPVHKAPVFDALPEVWVLELSSFQLDGVQAFAPDAGTVLNITQDHLDWHGDMAAYTEAKSRIYGPKVAADATAWPATVMVVNRDDPAVEALVPEPLKVRVAKGRPAKLVQRKVLRFGLDRPRRPGDFGLVEENGMAWLVRALEADETVKRHKRGGQDEEEEIHLQRLMPADALRIRGRHNAANALAALALATAIGCPLAPMLHGLREYTGEPHRVEYVATVNDIEAFDDSKGTNVGATVAALTGLGADKHPAKLVVILGGDGKGQDFTPLAEPVARHVRAVALIGRDADSIATALAASGVPLHRHDTLEAAVPWCFEQAKAGDAVLLSPACASLDMFRNYAHRAEVFVAAVQDLANDAGVFG